MTAPEQPTWHVAPDPDTGEDALWRDDTAVVRRSDLYRVMAPVDADGLFDTLTRVLAPGEATMERLAGLAATFANDAHDATFVGDRPSPEPREFVRSILAALSGTAAPHERDGEVCADG